MNNLMDDQKEASEAFEQWLNNSHETFCGLWASAGFGKSWSAKHIIQEVIVKNSNYTPLVTSMTNSAVGVLADFVDMEVKTLHSLMGWVPIANKETGEEGISTPAMRDKDAESVLDENTLVVVDEAGLMGHLELKLLHEECIKTGARVLMIGDNCQCFPVTRNDEELCVPAYDITETYLNLYIPKRTDKDDTIYVLSNKLRDAVRGESKMPKLETALNKGKKTGVRIVDDIEEYAYAAFRAGVRDGDTSNIKVLAFTNKRCLTLNRKIRKKVMNLSDPTPIVGEIMVANTSITQMDGEEVLIKNNQIATVKSVEKTDSFGLPGAFIQYVDEDGEDIKGVVFVPASPQKLRDRLHVIASEAAAFREAGNDEKATSTWKTYYNLKEGCADMRFTYAMTVNKAQGITLKHALVDFTDIDQCRDKEQKLRYKYTAVTRATDYVTIED